MPAHTVQIAFPEDVAQLEQYDAIVISDIGSNTFLLQNDTFYQLRIKPNALELIKEYVNNGGGLLMIGGYLSFMGIEAKANYKNTVLADVLPVTMLDGDDRVEKPEGVIAQPSQPEHPVIKGFSEYPFFLGYNRAIAKENAEVVLTINNAPLLVFGNYHNGKIACFMSGFAPIFPDTCYHLTHYWPAAADIPVASDNPVHYADAIRYNARMPLQGSLLPLTRLV